MIVIMIFNNFVPIAHRIEPKKESRIFWSSSSRKVTIMSYTFSLMQYLIFFSGTIYILSFFVRCLIDRRMKLLYNLAEEIECYVMIFDVRA